jgi:Protein of unknown function (DUF2786)
MSTDESRLDRIRKLLAMAEDPAATPAEAEAFTARATELISKWGLEDAIAEAAAEDRPQVTEKFLTMEGAYQNDKAYLLFRVARGLGVKTVQQAKSRATRGGVKVHVFGMPNDLARVELLFTSLLVQAAQGVAVAMPNPWENVKAYRRSWLLGFAEAIGDRLDAQRARDAREAGVGTDLVLFDRSKLVDQAVSKFYPSTRTARISRSGSGRYAGAAAGRRANLGTGDGIRNASGRALAR